MILPPKGEYFIEFANSYLNLSTTGSYKDMEARLLETP